MSLIRTIRTNPAMARFYAVCRDIKMLGVKTESDRHYIIRKFKKALGFKPNLENPVTFQEKLQWLKLHDRKPIYHTMVDKVDAKKFIADKLGNKELCIPTLGVFDCFDDIDFDKLPNEFILKCTHDSGSYCICTDKESFDIKKAKERLLVNYKYDYFYYSK